MIEAAQTVPAKAEIQRSYDAFKAKGLKLNLTRGKPASDQLDLCNGLLALPGSSDFTAEGATDVRNYGGLQGLIEVRRLFSGTLGASADQIVVGYHSRLALMAD